VDSFPDERVVRFNAEGPDGLIDRKAPGKRPRLEVEQRTALARAVEAGPKPYLDGVVRWRLIDLVQWLWEAFGVSLSETTVSRELRVPRGFGSSPPDRSTMPRILRPSSVSKKLPRPRGGDPQGAGRRQTPGTLGPRRGADRPEEQDHAPVGPPWRPAASPARSAHEMGRSPLSPDQWRTMARLRRHLSGRGQGRGARHASGRDTEASAGRI